VVGDVEPQRPQPARQAAEHGVGEEARLGGVLHHEAGGARAATAGAASSAAIVVRGRFANRGDSVRSPSQSITPQTPMPANSGTAPKRWQSDAPTPGAP